MSYSLLISLAAITFWNRFIFLAENVRFKPGAELKRFLGYSSYAILTAIWAPILFQYQPGVGLAISGWDYLIAASVAALLAIIKLRSILVVLISAGLFFCLRLFVFS